MKKFSEMTVTEQLSTATEAYIVCVKSTARFDAFAVYLRLPDEDELKVLWPQAEEPLVLTDHVFAANNLPAYYFRVTEMGMSRIAKLANTLHGVNPRLKVFFLGGGIPSLC